jgi:hypothetical protein
MRLMDGNMEDEEIPFRVNEEYYEWANAQGALYNINDLQNFSPAFRKIIYQLVDKYNESLVKTHRLKNIHDFWDRLSKEQIAHYYYTIAWRNSNLLYNLHSRDHYATWAKILFKDTLPKIERELEKASTEKDGYKMIYLRDAKKILSHFQPNIVFEKPDFDLEKALKLEEAKE